MKKNKRLLLLSLMFTGLFILSGCVETKNGVPTGEGWVYEYLVSPMGNLITFFAKDQGLGFGLGIVLTTLVVRLLIFPLGIYQAWKASYQSVKREHLKPILDPYQEAMKKAKEAGDQQETLRLQQELMAVQKENGISMLGGIGCLPVLIQMPFFTAIFYASRYTEGIRESNFLGMDLSKSAWGLTVIIAILYFAQTYISHLSMDPMQREQTKSMMFMTPIIMSTMSLSLPSSTGLYWLVGGVVQIIQQLIVHFFVRPHQKKAVAEELKNNPPKTRPLTSAYMKDVTPRTKAVSGQQPATPRKTQKKRNAGKQRSR